MMCSRAELLATAREMAAIGLVTGTLGNVSCRFGKRVLITPSALDYTAMRPDDLVVLDLLGNVVVGRRAPSSEYRLHLAIYARIASAHAIVHTHSPHAVMASSALAELPSSGGAAPRGPVPIAPFQPPGTLELADQAADLMAKQRSNAVLLERHGVVGIGADLRCALQICLEVERLARKSL